MAIPHHSGQGGGSTFPKVDSAGGPITAEYARTRMRWEPVAEVTQTGGDYETHPSLSPDDEFADFERRPGASDGEGGEAGGDYARSALLQGLQIEGEVGVNPYAFGLIGSTDSYTGLASVEEDNFWGAMAAQSSAAEHEAGKKAPWVVDAEVSAQGLAAVWAEENTRESIFAAFKRREVYATTGPRIRVRFFGGWGFSAKQADRAIMVKAGYTMGHPMGSDLTKAPEGKAPGFLMYAIKDPSGANLDRIQVVKRMGGRRRGSARNGVRRSLVRRPRTRAGWRHSPHRQFGRSVDGRYRRHQGSTSAPCLLVRSRFRSARAGLLLRAGTPSPDHRGVRCTMRSCLGATRALRGQPPTIQERAYSSPIWYTPSR